MATVRADLVPSIEVVPGARRPLWHDQALLPQGLLPVTNPRALVYCPLVYHPGFVGVCPLTITELLRVHQLPLVMDAPILAWGFDLTRPLPFESAPPPNMFASIIRQLQSKLGGVDTSSCTSDSTEPTTVEESWSLGLDSGRGNVSLAAP